MFTIEKKDPFDFPLFFISIGLWIFGIFLVYSATHLHESGPLAGLANKQVIWVIMGVVIILAVVAIPPKLFYSFSYLFYGGSLLLLVAALGMGVVSKGAGRWINLAGFQLQPSEFAKIGLLLALARYFAHKEVTFSRISSFIVPVLLIGVPFLLVLKQPDLGSALVFCAMALPMFFWAGLTTLEIFFLISPFISLALSAMPLILSFHVAKSLGIWEAIPWGIFFVVLCVILYVSRPPMFLMIGVVAANIFTAGVTTLIWNSFLKDYQKMRIISFINPAQDPFGAGYQVIQSKVAIGSGYLFGKGYLQGTQTRLSFLPEQHTDFIFSVLGEQFGFFGCIAVAALLFFVIFRCFMTTQSVRNRFVNLVIVGSTAIIAFHVFVNVAMTLGIMPVVGVPLPFLSYGGSFTISLGILLGFVLNARVKGHDF
ncbi:MAG: rod shape-determining protein RodA [Chitinivibrionales bacterium]|nr:rod shape-determining protein RodA [Chitinivibrionales bacterium]